MYETESKYPEGSVGASLNPRKYADEVETDKPDTEIWREIFSLEKTIEELGATCAGLNSAFSSVLRSEAKGENIGRPEQETNTRLAKKVAQIRRTAESIISNVNSVLERREI